jgi:hypothetical protein
MGGEGLSQALVYELTRIAVDKNDEWRSDYLEMIRKLGKEEVAFQICWRTYQWPTGTPKDALDEFAEKVPFERLLIIARRHGIKDAVDSVVSIAKMIPKFNPQGGFITFGEFIEKLLEIAEANGGSLVNYFNKFTKARDLEDELKKLPGIGPVLAPGLVRELRIADIIKLDISDLSLSPSEPVMRVLKRTCLISEGASPKDAENVIRKIFKISPMLLDAGVWYIGFNYCKEKPECDICPITHVCPKCIKETEHI